MERRISFSLSLIFTLTVATPCRGYVWNADASQQRIVHPISALIPRYGEAKEFIASSGKRGLNDVQAIIQPLLSPTELFTLGGHREESSERLGPVIDIKEGPAGNIYVLDGQRNEVKVYGSEGTFLYAVEGPSEEEIIGAYRRGSSGKIYFPASLEIDSSGRIIFADRSAGIKIFERTGDTHQVSEAFPLSLEIHEVCVRKDVLYVHGFNPGNRYAINRLSLSGNMLKSFGALYASSSPLVYRNLGMGQIACMDSRIIYAPNYLPVIYAYSPGGAMQWAVKIPDFNTMEIIETESDVSMGVFANPHDQIIRLAPLPEAYIIVQIASYTPEGLVSAKMGRKTGYDVLRTYMMSAQTGEAIFVGDTVPQIYAVTENRVYIARRHPFPQVSVLKR